MDGKIEWDIYRLSKKNIFFAETAIKFIGGKYIGKQGVIEQVTKKKYLKVIVITTNSRNKKISSSYGSTKIGSIPA